MWLGFITESGIKASQPRRETKSLTTTATTKYKSYKGGKSFVKSQSTNSGHKALTYSEKGAWLGFIRVHFSFYILSHRQSDDY